jgi:hypothetical protein
MSDFWLQRLRRAEEALARFYVAHRQGGGCTAPECELCREFIKGVEGGMNIYRPGEKPSFPPWMKILEDAGYAETGPK